MAFVVTAACAGCKAGDCIEVCPQRAFRIGPDSVVIDPEACTNCGVCALVCPVDAILPANLLRADQKKYADLNLQLSRIWPGATS